MQSSLLLCTAILLLKFSSVAIAHDNGHKLPIPGVFGGRNAIRRFPRHTIREIQAPPKPHLQDRGWKDAQKKCGQGHGFCNPGDCCSPVGFCGRGPAYCESPNCQIDYSDGCDGLIPPLGEPTLNVSRPLIGNVTYDGNGITQCRTPGTIALTFDDGPYNYTSHLLDVLAAYNAKATFFITGNNLNKGQIDVEDNGWPTIIRRMHAEGHQIAGHSWGHANLSSLNETTLVNQVHYLEMAFRNILGFFPTYFRPPYDDCQSNCQAVLKNMGYHITYQNIVNNDWQDDDGSRIESSKQLLLSSMHQTNPRDVDYIFLEHDTHYQSTWNLTSYMLDYFQVLNFSRLVTVGECMGDPPENWYRAATGAANHTLLLHNRNEGNARHHSTLLLMLAQLLAMIIL